MPAKMVITRLKHVMNARRATVKRQIWLSHEPETVETVRIWEQESRTKRRLPESRLLLSLWGASVLDEDKASGVTSAAFTVGANRSRTETRLPESHLLPPCRQTANKADLRLRQNGLQSSR